MDKVFRRETRRMDAPAFKDRHPVLHPEQRPLPVQLREQEPRPATVARMASEQLRQGGAGRSRQMPPPVQPAGELADLGRTTFAADDQGKASSHTTHNAYVLLLFLSGESERRVNPATRKLLKVDFFQELADFADHVLSRRRRDCERHVMTVEFDLFVTLVLEPAGGPRGNQPVPPRPDRKMWHRRLVGYPRQRRIVDRMLRHQFIELPDVVLPGIAGKRRAQGDHRLHRFRVVAGIFTPEEAAEAPADNYYRSIMPQALDTLVKLQQRVGPGSEIPALLPAVHSETGASELASKRKGRLVAAQKARNDQHRLPVQRAARAALSKRAEHPSEVPGDLAPIAVGRRRVVALPLMRGLGPVQRNSQPISCCIAAGSFTRPSAIWWFSRSGTRIRGLAKAVLLSVCAKRTFPSDPR